LDPIPGREALQEAMKLIALLECPQRPRYSPRADAPANAEASTGDGQVDVEQYDHIGHPQGFDDRQKPVDPFEGDVLDVPVEHAHHWP
jgi:hypothetical protein